MLARVIHPLHRSERERERERERGRERGGGERERQREYLFLKGMMGALAPFSYLVYYIDHSMLKDITNMHRQGTDI